MKNDDDDSGSNRRLPEMFYRKAAARTTDPDTSWNAKTWGLRMDRVLALITHAQHPSGLTDYELAARTGKQQNSIGKRRSELRDAGYIAETNIKRPAPSGSSCIVWVITASGIALAQIIKQMEGSLT